MKTLLFIFFAAGLTLPAFCANDFEALIQKGLEQMDKINTAQDAVNTVNYFERVANANPKEWLPLYYAGYASLNAGFRQENATQKDEWYTKGLDFIRKAKLVTADNSEIYALEGYLSLMYISVKPQQRAPSQTQDAIMLLEKSKKLDPSNPRPWFVRGQNTYYTPEFFGGGAANAKPMLEKADALYESFKKQSNIMPDWGKERCKMLLAECK